MPDQVLVNGDPVESQGNSHNVRRRRGVSVSMHELPSASRPPIIYRGPRDGYDAEGRSGRFAIPCIAKGQPSPTYRWLKNDKALSLDESKANITMLKDSGTIVMDRGHPENAGFYQCVAENELGVSLSERVEMRYAILRPFPFPPTPEEIHRVTLGQSLTLSCSPPLSVPAPRTSWTRTDKPLDVYEYSDKMDLPFTDIVYLNTAPRVTLGDGGRLHFTDVTKEDERYFYYCIVSNFVFRKVVIGSRHTIKVTGIERFFPPQLVEASSSEVTGFVGFYTDIKCFFSGNPIPSVTWERVDGKDISRSRYSLPGDQTLTIWNSSPNTAGAYKCIGRNVIDSIVHTKTKEFNFNLNVYAQPSLIEAPKDVNAIIGEKAVFTCKAEGTPIPDVKLMINGLDLEDPDLKDKRFLQPSPSQLVFPKLKASGRLVVQCTASNEYGHVFTEAYLNVLVPEHIRATNWNSTAKAVTITWQGAANQIHVHLCERRTRCRNVLVSGRGNHQHTFAGIKPGIRYAVRLRTDTGYRTGPYVFRIPRPGRKIRYEQLSTIIFRHHGKSVCIVPRRISGVRYLINRDEPFIQLMTDKVNGRVVPKEIAIAQDRWVAWSKFNVSAWRFSGPHPGFKVTSTRLNNLVWEHERVTLTITRTPRYSKMMYHLEIVWKPRRFRNGMIQMLNLVDRLVKKNKKAPPVCRGTGVTASTVLYERVAFYYRTKPYMYMMHS